MRCTNERKADRKELRRAKILKPNIVQDPSEVCIVASLHNFIMIEESYAHGFLSPTVILAVCREGRYFHLTPLYVNQIYAHPYLASH